MADYKLPEGCALMLRVCDADGRSYGGFQWPGVAYRLDESDQFTPAAQDVA